MKKHLLLSYLLSTALGFSESQQWQDWTSSDGRTAQMELLTVKEGAKGRVATFRLKNGNTVDLPESKLSEISREKLAAHQNPTEPSATAAKPEQSVYASFFEGNLLSLQQKRLKKLSDFTEPTQYYLFYKTASWCPPCQKFTPSLVDFYETQRKKHPSTFEIILLSSDRDEDAAENYAQNKNMQWPHLKLRKTEKFNEKFPFPGRGIPNLILTDLKGNILKTSYVNGEYLGPAQVMHHLKGLLQK